MGGPIGDALPRLDVPRSNEHIEMPGGAIDSVLSPRTAGELGDVVVAAAADRSGLLVIGGGTRLGCANPAREIALGVSMAEFSGIDEFEPDEGVLHAGAGTPLAELREAVAEEGWELPLDAPGPRTTVGGTIASAATGPRSQAFGPVRDAILGLEVVAGDGVASKCGGRVVKNVTGYDMAKLYCGSYGSLAIVTGAWLRLRPAPALRTALRAEVPSEVAIFEAVRELAGLGSVRALVWCERPGAGSAEVLVELGGSAEGVAHDRARIAEVLAPDEIGIERIDALRDDRANAASPVVVRARGTGSHCDALRRRFLEAGLVVSIDSGLGVVHARGELSEVDELVRLRESARAAGGFATFEAMPDAWRGSLDVFGALDGTGSIVAELARRFDPAGILNPGRFVSAATPEGEGGFG